MILISSLLISYTLYWIYLEEKRKRRKLLSQKKSSEVLLGQISEHLAPFLDSFPIDEELKELNFLGMPIDYIHFGEDKVTFIEVKSGGSKLSKKQRRIRDLIKDGKVEFKIHQIK